MFVIQASSSSFNVQNVAKIIINGVPVEMEANCNGDYRGLHIVVMNSQDGLVETAKVFDTYESSTLFEEFIETAIPDGHIVIAACQDECVTQLS